MSCHVSMLPVHTPMRIKQLVLFCFLYNVFILIKATCELRTSGLCHYHCEWCITKRLCFLLQLCPCHITSIVDSLQRQNTGSETNFKICTLFADTQWTYYFPYNLHTGRILFNLFFDCLFVNSMYVIKLVQTLMNTLLQTSLSEFGIPRDKQDR